VNVRYKNHPRKPGYGMLYVENIETASADVRFALIRSSDHNHMHPERWEAAECRLKPDSVTIDHPGLCLNIGPDVVRQLDELDTYRFVFFPPAGGNPEQATLEFAESIVYPPEKERDSVNAAPMTIKTDPAPAPPPKYVTPTGKR